MKSCKSIVLREASLSAKWIDTYRIHKQYRLSPFLLSETCGNLASQGILEVKGRQVRLTQEGRIWLIQKRRSVFSSDRPWARPSPYLLDERVPPKTPYFPKLSLLDTDFFEDIV
ncbi:MAG: hypothetical protein ABJP79_09470 [Tateyamaria sp.]|uniref:hypothetical protein n=1 Tax=Tateyamaria sp. TaxID=1929288 RepID=UPI00329EB577